MNALQKTELNHLQSDLADETSHYKQFRALLVLALIVTLVAYLFFSSHLKLGNPLYWGEYFNKGTVTQIAFFVVLISVILLGVFLAWVKHFAYSHFTTYRAMVGVMITLIGFALIAEMFAALEDQKAKADIQLAGNDAFKSTLVSSALPVGMPTHFSNEIATASQNLARCKAKLGKPGYPHCDGDKARLAELKQQQAAALTAQVTATKEMEKQRYERQDQMKADAHNDFIVGFAKFYSSIFGAGAENAYVDFIAWANITLMLIIAVAFERLHAFLIEAGRDIKGNIRGIEQRIAQLQNGVSLPMGDLPKAGIPLFQWQAPKPKQTGIGFTAPISAPANVSKPIIEPAPNVSKSFGFIPSRPRPTPQPEQTIVMPANSRPTPDDYAPVERKELTVRERIRKGENVYPTEGLDVPAKTVSETSSKPVHRPLANGSETTSQTLSETTSEPLAKGFETTSQTLSETTSEPQAGGFAGGSKTTEKTLSETTSETTSQTLSETTSEPLAKGFETTSETTSEPLAKGFAGGSDLYAEWVIDVRAGLVKPSVEPTWRWIQKRISAKETGTKTIDRTRISLVQKTFFERAIREGFMILNPNYSNGGKKYIWK